MYGVAVPMGVAANDEAPAASSSAVLVCQGRAIADGRYAAGRFSDPVARELLDAGELEVVDRVRAEELPSGGLTRIGYEMVRGTGILMVPRTVAIDDAVREHGAPQVVILGAGLDARAYRMRELADALVFEVDHAASQRDKQLRAAAMKPIGRLVLVVADLARERLDAPLREAGFDPSVPTTWIWEGVVPYLTRDAVLATITQVAELSALGSRLVLNYQAKSLAAAVMRKFFRILLWIARQPDPFVREPWRSLWSPQQISAVLAEHGFEVTSDNDLLTLAAGLELPPDAARSMHGGHVAVALRG